MCDKYLLRKLFQTVQSCPVIALYCETNVLPLRFVLMGRRLMFLWTILNKPDSEFVRQVYNTQLLFPVHNDWVYQIRSDKELTGIDLSDNEIKLMSKYRFKKLVKEKLEGLMDEYIDLNKSSKTKFIHKREFQEYLQTDKLTLKQKDCFSL